MQQLSLPEFADKINEIMPVIVKEFSRRQFSRLGQISLPQFLILGFLGKEGESKMTGLAHFLRVSTPAMTGIIDRLVRDGYAVREYDSRDRRIIKIRITSKGNRLVKEVMGERRKMVIKIFGKVSEQDRSDYLRVLMRIRDILSKEDRG